jgi:hypothetical protein
MRKRVLQDNHWNQVEMHKNRRESAKQKTHFQKCANKGDGGKPTYTNTWTEAPTWRRSRPSLKTTRARRWWVGPARVRLHPQRHLSGPPRSGSCMPPCLVGFRRFPNLPTPNRPTLTYKHGWCSPPTHTTQEPLSLHLYSFTIFSSVVKSLARLVIEVQEHLEDVWYDQYNVLHCDSCHVLHLVVVLILSL